MYKWWILKLEKSVDWEEKLFGVLNFTNEVAGNYCALLVKGMSLRRK